MKLLNRIAIICNICFFSLIFLEKISSVRDYQFAAGLVAILGVGALLVNILILFLTFIFFLLKKRHLIPKYMFTINMLCMVFQIAFFFF